MTVPTDFSASFRSRLSWRIWGIVLLGTLLVHGVLLFFLPSLLLSPSTSQQPSLLVQLLEFSPALPKELFSTEEVPEEILEEEAQEAEPKIEFTTLETIESEIAEKQELPAVVPVPQKPLPQESLTSDPDVPELKPEETLNALIQEKESEQLSMKLTKAAQKPASAQQPSPSLEGLLLAEAALPQPEIESAPLEVTEQTEIEEIQTTLPDLVIPQEETMPAFKEKSEILELKTTEQTAQTNEEKFLMRFPKSEEQEKIQEESLLSEFGEVSAENQAPSELAILEPRKKVSPQTAEIQGKSPLPENYFLNPHRQKQLESQNSASPSQKRLPGPGLAGIPSVALENFSSSLRLNRPGAGKQPSLHPQPQISVGFQNSSGMAYGLNDYNWPYESYMGRWAKAILYSWGNHPPQDYITGRVPAGGNLFVLATLNRKGELISYEVTQVENASELMVTSVLDAIQGATHLPPLPPDFKKQELQAHFKFIYPSIHHLLRRNRR